VTVPRLEETSPITKGTLQNPAAYWKHLRATGTGNTGN
jgi:hypothetical protein